MPGHPKSAGRANGRPSIAFASYSTYPDGTPDDRWAVEALQRRGVRTETRRWDDAAVDWGRYDLVVLRSTWDYFERLESFLEWLAHVAQQTRVLNDPRLVEWNSRKQYLLELAQAGHPVVPTVVVPGGDPPPLAPLLRAQGWARAVVKPAVSAASVGLFRVESPDDPAAETAFRQLLQRGDVLVQPLLAAVPRRGERSLVFFDGRFSHSAEYPYLLAADPPNERQATRRHPAPEEIAVCERILRGLPTMPLYARLDFLPDEDGNWLLGELELIEPELLFRSDPAAAERFADVVTARLGAGAPDEP